MWECASAAGADQGGLYLSSPVPCTFVLMYGLQMQCDERCESISLLQKSFMWVLLPTQPEQHPDCCYHFSYYRNTEPRTSTWWEAVPGQVLTNKTDSTATNKRENHCQVQDPQSGMRRSIGESITPTLHSPSHITLQTQWPVSPVGPVLGPGSCDHNGEKWKPVPVNWKCLSARQDWKWLQQQLPFEASLTADKEENFVFICAPPQTKLTDWCS